jgi:hypothetical protein
VLRTLQGLVLGLIAQGVGHALLAWPFQVHFFPPNAWHLLPFLLGGLVCGAYARRARPGFFVALPYAAMMVVADVAVDPGVSAPAILLVVAGLALGTITCGLMARRRRVAAHIPTPSPEQRPRTPASG